MRIPIFYKNRSMVRIPCPVCLQGEDTLLFKLGTALFPINISFCRFCGFIFQNPRPSEKVWNEYYSSGYYDKFHRPRPYNEDIESKSVVGTVPFKRINQYLLINGRRHGIVLKGNRVCEIGAGSGGVITSFDGNELYAIEPSKECRFVLERKGISNVWASIDEARDSSFKSEVIIIRHVLEHVYYPKRFLEDACSLLADNGIIYIAVPNILVSNFINMFTYPHISYFSIHTLQYLCKSVGFDVLEIKQMTDEIWCILSTNKHSQRSMEKNRKEITLIKNITDIKEITEKNRNRIRPLLLKRLFIRYISNIFPIRLQIYIYERRNRL